MSLTRFDDETITYSNFRKESIALVCATSSVTSGFICYGVRSGLKALKNNDHTDTYTSHSSQKGALKLNHAELGISSKLGLITGFLTAVAITSYKPTLRWYKNAGDFIHNFFYPKDNPYYNPNHYKDYSKPVKPKYRARKAAGIQNNQI